MEEEACGHDSGGLLIRTQFKMNTQRGGGVQITIWLASHTGREEASREDPGDF